MNVRAFAFQDHPNAVFIPILGVLSFFALRLTPSPVPIVLTLAILLVYSRILFHAEQKLRNTAALAITIAVGGTLSRLSPSLHALSSSASSVLVLFAISTATSILALLAVYIDTRLCTRLQGGWSQITLFPALWVTLWYFVAYVSPIGRLSAWSSTEGGGVYAWMTPFLGAVGNDWVAAAWAVVFSQAIGTWYMGAEDEQPLITQDAPASEQFNLSSLISGTRLLGLVLILLSVPSFLLRDLPLAIQSPETTPLSVGCILPPLQRYRHHALTLKDYIDESKIFTSSAKILLWPEGAITFNSESERDEGLAEVRKSITGSYVGVSFEELFSPSNGSRRSSSRRTGIALISPSSTSPHLIYYKRHLVPIAESFSLTHSTAPPGIFTLELPHPKDVNKTEWAPPPSYTRPIPLSTSICLDFSDPFPFAHLDSRPAIVLAPARTWDISIGYAMWQQARQRAEELGTTVLWCDGGDGGVSGVAGGGFHDVSHVGSGSWVKTIGIEYPFNGRRTPYTYLGNFTILIFWALIFGRSLGGRIFLMHQGASDIQRWYRRVRNPFTPQRVLNSAATNGDLLG